MSVLFPSCIRQRSRLLPTLCRRTTLLLLVLAFTPSLAALPNSTGTGQTRLAFPVPTAQPDTPTNLVHQGHQEPQPAQEPRSASDISESAHRANRTDALSSATAQIFQNRPLRVGIISLWEQPVTTEALMNTLETIEKAFAPYSVEIYPRIPSPKLEHLIETGNIDVFIASSGFSMRMSPHGVLPVATLITDLQPNPNTGVATTFLVRADEENIKTIADLKDKRLSASYASAFMSYRTGLGEIAVRGYDPEHFSATSTLPATAKTRPSLPASIRIKPTSPWFAPAGSSTSRPKSVHATASSNPAKIRRCTAFTPRAPTPTSWYPCSKAPRRVRRM